MTYSVSEHGVSWSSLNASRHSVQDTCVFRAEATMKLEHMGAQPETPWIHYTFYFELIFGHSTFRNLLLWSILLEPPHLVKHCCIQ